MPSENRFSLTTKRIVIGQVSVCLGCCCGNTGNGKPPVPVDWLKKEWRVRGLMKRVQLTISGCLGPCDVPNVVAVSDGSGTQWLGEITEFEQYREILEWAVRSRCGRVASAAERISRAQSSSILPKHSVMNRETSRTRQPRRYWRITSGSGSRVR